MTDRDRKILEALTTLARGRAHALDHRRDFEHLDLAVQLAQRQLRDLLALDE